MNTISRLERQKELLIWVKAQHEGQKRKYTGHPYHTHLEAVAELATRYEKRYPFIYEIAICHDLLEDTDSSFEELRLVLQSIGYAGVDATTVAYAVLDLTDVYTKDRYPNLNRKIRKEKEAQRLGRIDFFIQSVKYADMIDNIKSIVQHDPSFAKVYLEEKKQLIDKMREGNVDLLIECCYLLKIHSVELIPDRV